MQDSYIGDIGDYGKYGLLREVSSKGVSLFVNWYRVVHEKESKQDDGKFINYLSLPQIYRGYDPYLFDSLYSVVMRENNRLIERIEAEKLFRASFYSKEIRTDRYDWHRDAVELSGNAEVVFLDPDNGLETEKMHKIGGATKKHVKWEELKDYYSRGKNVILYQHRPQMTPKDKCIEAVVKFQNEFLHADCVKLLEFPKYTNRFYFMFLHSKYQNVFDEICKSMIQKWSKNGFCREIILN